MKQQKACISIGKMVAMTTDTKLETLQKEAIGTGLFNKLIGWLVKSKEMCKSFTFNR